MRKEKKLLFPLFVFIIFFLVTGCSQNRNVSFQNDEKIKIMVSILPQVDFVERIGGDKVEASEMIPPGFSPATYNPSPEQLKKLQKAELYFRIGHIPFEKAQMEKLKQINSDMKVIDTSIGVDLLTLATHDHQEDHEEGNDPHIWLSPQLVKVQGEHIYQALVESYPEYKDYFLANYNQFVKDLEFLDRELKNVFSLIKGKTILVFHPAFGYLADAYDFEQEAIEIEGKDPSPEHLQIIIDKAKSEGIEVIFVQKQFSTKSANSIAQEIGGAVVQIDPLAQNYFENLKLISETIIQEIK